MPLQLNPSRPVGFESRKSYARRCREGFWDAFMSPGSVLDIGYRGGLPDALPIVPWAVGIEPDHIYIGDQAVPWTWYHDPNRYDGVNLPFAGEVIDTIYASHVLEHLEAPTVYLKEWMRVLHVGGTLIVTVPSAYLYERRLTVPPSRWSPEHLRSFTPGSLLELIEEALDPNSYRVAAFFEDDTGYDYSLPIEQHPVGALELVIVLRKITKPEWNIEP
jgi:SAM-dependent methyltransferase